MWCKFGSVPRSFWYHLVLLLLWVGLGAGLRFANLAAKPLWTDEFSTIVFSLGHSFRTIGLDEMVSLEALLQPLQYDPRSSIQDVVHRLLDESNHPPLYFVLTHLWLKLMPISNGLVSAWDVRSLSALLGVASIPATFGLGWLAFRSRLVGQIAAALMALSPFNIYLAQEARHYTLAILWVIASLCCLIVAARAVFHRVPLPIWIGIAWVIINGLGIATHYFFVLTLVAEALVLLSLGLIQSWREGGVWRPSYWGRIVVVGVGTLVSGLIWLPFLQSIPDDQLTQWIFRVERTGSALLGPIGQALAGWITMLYLLPIQASSETVVTISGVVLILLVLWTLPRLYTGLRIQCKHYNTRYSVLVLGCFVGQAIAIFFFMTYAFTIDLLSAFRYNFVYFPAVMVLVGAALASIWDAAVRIARSKPTQVSYTLLRLVRGGGRNTVVLIGIFSFLGGLTVVTDLGYQKTHRPDVVAHVIEDTAQVPTLVAINYQTHGQTGRLMGIALELQQDGEDSPHPTLTRTNFLMIKQGTNPKASTTVLRRALRSMPRPANIWLLNFKNTPEMSPIHSLLQKQQCLPGFNDSVDGYQYQLYQCQPPPRS